MSIKNQNTNFFKNPIQSFIKLRQPGVSPLQGAFGGAVAGSALPGYGTAAGAILGGLGFLS